MYCTVSAHVGRVRPYYLSGGTVFRGDNQGVVQYGIVLLPGDNLGSGKCILYRGVLSHWGELTYGEIR